MMKRRFIAFFFACVLMVNLVHNMVPHHHHLDSIVSHRDCQQQDEDNNDFHPGDPKSHCHAFNGMEYYPSPETTGTFNPTQTVIDLFLYHVFDAVQSVSVLESYRLFEDILLFFNHFIYPSTGLRAPPGIS
jgi:hypothetical protein